MLHGRRSTARLLGSAFAVVMTKFVVSIASLEWFGEECFGEVRTG